MTSLIPPASPASISGAGGGVKEGGGAGDWLLVRLEVIDVVEVVEGLDLECVCDRESCDGFCFLDCYGIVRVHVCVCVHVCQLNSSTQKEMPI